MDARWVAPATLLVLCWIGFIGLLTGHDPVRLPLLTVLGGSHGEMRFTTVSALESLDVRLDGEVEFTDDDRGIRGISEGGRLEIRYRDGLQRRRLVVRPDSQGGVRYDYEVRGRDHEFDAEGREWLAGILPRIIRETGIGAEARVARILARDGVAGVLEEIDRIESGSAAVRYCSELREQGELDSAGRGELLRRCSEAIRSSGDKARFLIAAAGETVGDPGSAEAFFRAADSVPSSGDHARVLLAVLREGRLDAPTYAELLRSARGIPSSGDKARVLIEAGSRFFDEPAPREAFFRAADSVPSSGDRARVLIAMLERSDPDAETLRRLLDSASGIPSSGDKTRVLLRAVHRVAGDEALREAYLEATASIPSPGDRDRARSAVLR